MIKIRLSVLDDDEKYIQKLTSFFITKYPKEIEMYSFTNLADAEHFLSKDKNIDVFLCTENIIFNTKILSANCGFAYLSEKKSVEKVNGEKVISKYQKIDLIYSEILKLFSEHSVYTMKQDKSDKKTKLYMVTSAAGGVGASTVAAAIAEHFTIKEQNVLYVNLETFGMAESFFENGGSGSLSDIFYAIKSKNSNVQIKAKSLIKKSEIGTSYFNSFSSSLDLDSITAQEMEEFIACIESMGEYEKVVFDVNLQMNDIVKTLLKHVDCILLVSDGSEIASVKTLRAIDSFSVIEKQQQGAILDKVKLAYNKFSNRFSKQIEIDGVATLGGAQKFDGATTKQIVKQLAGLAFFDNI